MAQESEGQMRRVKRSFATRPTRRFGVAPDSGLVVKLEKDLRRTRIDGRQSADVGALKNFDWGKGLT